MFTTHRRGANRCNWLGCHKMSSLSLASDGATAALGAAERLCVMMALILIFICIIIHVAGSSACPSPSERWGAEKLMPWHSFRRAPFVTLWIPLVNNNGNASAKNDWLLTKHTVTDWEKHGPPALSCWLIYRSALSPTKFDAIPAAASPGKKERRIHLSLLLFCSGKWDALNSDFHSRARFVPAGASQLAIITPKVLKASFIFW
jgi:hypothetical protein